MNRTTVVNVTLGALAVGLIASSAAWTLLHSDTSREVAPVAVSALSDVSSDPAADVSADPSAPAADATDPASVPAALPSSDDPASSDGGVAVPEGVTVDRARQIALGVKQGTVHEVELEDVAGRTAWKVDVRGAAGRWQVYVDAVTGEVLATRSHD